MSDAFIDTGHATRWLTLDVPVPLLQQWAKQGRHSSGV